MPLSKILLAPFSFKGTLSAAQAARAMANGLQRVPGLSAKEQPQADGGEGTLDFFKDRAGWESREVTFPQTDGGVTWQDQGVWLWHEATRVALIESAQVCGLPKLLRRTKSPWACSSFGVGMMINMARRAKAREIWVAVGGTGTVDGGLGLLESLCSPRGAAPRTPMGGHSLAEGTVPHLNLEGLSKFGLHHIRALLDVQSPLKGPEGTRRFMAQKLVPEALAPVLEEGLGYLMAGVFAHLGKTWTDQPGFGAGGGLGAALVGLGAEPMSGADFLIARFMGEEVLKDFDVVITGEGSLDEQTFAGKGIARLAQHCAQNKTPVVVFCGRNNLVEQQWNDLKLHQVIALQDWDADLPEGTQKAAHMLSAALTTWGKQWLAMGRDLKGESG